METSDVEEEEIEPRHFRAVVRRGPTTRIEINAEEPNLARALAVSPCSQE
jgi:hypothetical protein